MTTKFKLTFNCRRAALAPPALAAVLLCASGGLTVVLAQGVLAPPPPDFSGLPPEARITGANQPGEMPPLVTPGAANEPLAQVGPVQIRPHLLYRFLYGDGIPAVPGEAFTTAIHEIYPGILLDLGSHWHLDYTPVLRFYSNKNFRDSTDHTVTLAGSAAYEDWTFGLLQTNALTSDPLIETGTQTDEEDYSTALSAICLLSTATSLELGANQYFRFVGQGLAGEELADSRSWSTLDWLNYQFGSKIGAAIGAGFGYDNLSVGSDMTFEQLHGRTIWRPGEKLSLSIDVGVEDRQFLGASISDAINPIFGLGITYQLFEATALSLTAARVVSPTYFQNEISESTAVSAALRQRLLKRLYLNVSGGYGLTSYSATAGGLDVNREDNITFVNVSLSTEFLKRGTASIFYRHTEDSSNAAGFTLSSSLVGAELGYRF